MPNPYQCQDCTNAAELGRTYCAYCEPHAHDHTDYPHDTSGSVQGICNACRAMPQDCCEAAESCPAIAPEPEPHTVTLATNDGTYTLTAPRATLDDLIRTEYGHRASLMHTGDPNSPERGHIVRYSKSSGGYLTLATVHAYTE